PVARYNSEACHPLERSRSVPQGSDATLRVTYLVHAAATDVAGRAEALLLEQTVELPRAAATRDPWVAAHILGCVEQVVPAGEDRRGQGRPRARRPSVLPVRGAGRGMPSRGGGCRPRHRTPRALRPQPDRDAGAGAAPARVREAGRRARRDDLADAHRAAAPA